MLLPSLFSGIWGKSIEHPFFSVDLAPKHVAALEAEIRRIEQELKELEEGKAASNKEVRERELGPVLFRYLD